MSVIFIYNSILLLSAGALLNYILVSAVVIAVLRKLHVFYKQKKYAEFKQIQQESRIKFETRYAETKIKYANDASMIFDFPYIHQLLKHQNIPLQIPSFENTEQLLLLQKDHLQVTCNLTTFWRHLKHFKANRKTSAVYNNDYLPEKIMLGLWQFKEGSIPEIFKTFVRRQIISGNISVWNLKTEQFETEMINTEIKTFENCFKFQYEKFCCGETEFYKYRSCFYSM